MVCQDTVSKSNEHCIFPFSHRKLTFISHGKCLIIKNLASGIIFLSCCKAVSVAERWDHISWGIKFVDKIRNFARFSHKKENTNLSKNLVPQSISPHLSASDATLWQMVWSIYWAIIYINTYHFLHCVRCCLAWDTTLTS